MTDQLGPAPWAADVEAWIEVSNAEEIADDIERYTLAEVARAVAAERERCAKLCDHQVQLQMDTGAEDGVIAQAKRCAMLIRRA